MVVAPSCCSHTTFPVAKSLVQLITGPSTPAGSGGGGRLAAIASATALACAAITDFPATASSITAAVSGCLKCWASLSGVKPRVLEAAGTAPAASSSRAASVNPESAALLGKKDKEEGWGYRKAGVVQPGRC